MRVLRSPLAMLVLATALWVAPGYARPHAGAVPQLTDEASVPRISLADLKKAVDAGRVLVLDVRDAASYAESHIPGAVLIPLADLQGQTARLKASKKPIVAYCG